MRSNFSRWGEPIKNKNPKFLYCISNSNGYVIIGILELVALGLGILNCFYSLIGGLIFSIIFSLPLVIALSAS